MVKTHKWYYLHHMTSAYFPINRTLQRDKETESKRERERDKETDRERERERCEIVKAQNI